VKQPYREPVPFAPVPVWPDATDREIQFWEKAFVIEYGIPGVSLDKALECANQALKRRREMFGRRA
jgi:hypothetical protein